MIYIHMPSLKQMKIDADSFYAKTLKEIK